MRLAKIEKSMIDLDIKELAWRKERLNKRKISGIDKIISLALPSWIKK
jgi:hypothetical protein